MGRPGRLGPYGLNSRTRFATSADDGECREHFGSLDIVPGQNAISFQHAHGFADLVMHDSPNGLLDGSPGAARHSGRALRWSAHSRPARLRARRPARAQVACRRWLVRLLDERGARLGPARQRIPYRRSERALSSSPYRVDKRPRERRHGRRHRSMDTAEASSRRAEQAGPRTRLVARRTPDQNAVCAMLRAWQRCS
ncbi:hypothetical protein STPH1_3370 [Streptomyces sp. OM5714]|nr:hypothetical protein STPH1_3370 [Streptomyces sp. OM5714]